ncbi:MAG: ATP-binding cassette domain-containing protein [Pseudomonadota bacterium]|nr:MAG: ATP-binding cassette domain-containing protein [Pseudomonadota bacterium]
MSNLLAIDTPVVLEGVRKQFAGRTVLDVSRFVIAPSCCTFLAGDNGAGKTTLLRIAAGLDAPDQAAVTIDGCCRDWAAAQKQLQGNVIYFHQVPYLFDSTVADNIAYGLRFAMRSRAAIRQRVDAALDWAGLGHLAERNARQLSGGERQRVALVRAWVLAPRVLLLDEPLSAIDAHARAQTVDLIRRLKHDGAGLVITGHQAEALMPVVDERLHLQHGELSQADTTHAAGSRHQRGAPPLVLVN